MSVKHYWFVGGLLTFLGCSNGEQPAAASEKEIQPTKAAPTVAPPVTRGPETVDGVTYTPVPAEGFRSNLPGWQPSADFIVTAKKGHAPSHIMWGPSIRLPAGAVKGYVKLRVGELDGVEPQQQLCGFDVFDGKQSLTEAPVVAGGPELGAARNVPFAFALTPDQANANIEFRLYCWGRADVTVDSVYLSTPT
jgi:hypothetical protein